MKPTVIASGGSENPSSHHPAGNSVNPAANMGPNFEGGTGAPSTSPNSRQFPQFQTGFGFDPEDDIFLDAGLRSRLNRFRDPFSFARKRCGNGETTDDPYSRYFDDDSDFFPNFGSLSGRRRAPSQNASSANPSTFFEHIPAQFRHYIPDDFGFSNARTTSAPHPQYQQQAPPQQAHPQQYYEAYVQPSSPTAQPPQQKPKLCDAAIQTEDFSEIDGTKEGKHLKQYGMRNTVDLGQKSPPEECRGPRSHSAPPTEQNPQEQCAPNLAHPPNAQIHTEDPQHTSQGTQPMTPPHPPPRQQAQQPQYQTWQQHQQQQQQQQPQFQQTPQQPHATSPGGGFTRTVPIFVEGRSDPVISKKVIPPQQQQPTRPTQPQQPQKQKPGHPTPINTQQPTPASSQVPPQTPHTAECISKIQAIQRDVLNLMAKVEHFQGLRGDREYMFLDEMLTRNLLKLDTIDTNGKDSIRLARREAIKCIQASINVLEAKSEENAKTAAQPPEEQAVIDGSAEENKITEEAKAEQGASEVKESAQDEAVNLPPENVAIPLPPPPTKEPPAVPIDEPKKVEEATKEETKPAEDVKPKEENQDNTDQKTAEPTEKEKPAEKAEAQASPGQPDTKPVEEKDSEEKPQISSKTEHGTQKKPESGTESESAKPVSTGAIKKKIVKKKKAPAEAASPPENTAPEIVQQAENTEQKSEKDPSQP